MSKRTKVEVERMSCFAEPLYHHETGEQVSAGLDDRGFEVPDPVPMAIPAGMHQGTSLAETIQRMLRHQLMAQAAAAEGFDTFEEAEDFEIEDDPLDPHTSYEDVFDPLTQRSRHDMDKAALKDELTKSKGDDDGERDLDPDERRMVASDDGSRRSGEKRQGKSKSDKVASDKRGVREAASSDQDPDQ